MITIVRTFEWDMGHRVPNHESICRNPHGHRYVMNVFVTGALNAVPDDPSQGMIVDFGKLKGLINEHVVSRLDHSFMYFKDDSAMAPFAAKHNDFRMNVVPFIPTAEMIAEHIAEVIIDLFKRETPELSLSAVEVYETPKSKAIWSRDA